MNAFPFLSDRIEDLKRELPSYLAKVDDVSSEVDKLEWWKKHANQLSAACKLIMLVQPSSAAAERGFFFAVNELFLSSKPLHWRTLLKLPLCFNTIIDNSE